MGECVNNSAGSRSRWVGPPLAPQLKRGKSPGETQRHYGAVVLPGSGRQVYVNDVVEVLPKHNNSGYSEKGCYRLSQVISLWEDTSTGVFKFRARWLIHASDLPKDVLSRLRAARRSFSRSGRPSKSGMRRCDDEVGDEVFPTPKMDDLEVRLIVRPVMLSVTSTSSAGTEIAVELKGSMGPRLTHSYDDSTGDFVPVDNTDSILKRARVRPSEDVDIALSANEEHEETKNGEPVKSTGWLLPKRSVFDRKGRGEIGSHYPRIKKVDRGSYSSLASPVHVGSPASGMDIGITKNSEPGVLSNSKNEETEKGDGRNSEQTSMDKDLSGSSMQNATVMKGFVPRKLTGQQKSQWSSDSDAKIISVFSVTSLCSTSKLSPSSQRPSHVAATKGARPLCRRPRRLDMPPISETWQKVAVPVGGGDVCTTIVNHFKTRQTRSSRKRGASKAPVENSRKLTRSTSSSPPTNVSQPVVSGRKRREYTTTSATSIPANNKYFAKKISEKEGSGHPLRHTPVGKNFQAVIPELLSYEGKKVQSAGTGAQMVWQSIRDWDPQSRGMLAYYLSAANKVVKAKQERPGVAVHVRLGGGCGGVAQEDGPIDNSDYAGSYAVWALTASRDTCGVARLACSETVQTEVPRSAVQRVQCEEEALAALVKTQCILGNIEPALDLLANTSSDPQSIEQWTLAQVRTLERTLHDEFDPKRHLHGWARSGMAMDREDFIDLAKVSKCVPGKTPAQVLAFYYRYLAAAEPLTDVVYGPKTKRLTLEPTLVFFYGNTLAPIKAAEARQQEIIRLDGEMDKPGCWGGGPVRDKSHTANLSAGARQMFDESPRVIPAKAGIGVGWDGSNSLPERGLRFKLQDVELSSHKSSQEHILEAGKTNHDQSTTADRSVAEVVHKKAEQPLRPFTTGQRSSGASTSSVSIPGNTSSSQAVEDITPVCFDPTKRRPFDGTCNDEEGARRVGNETTPRTCAVTIEDAWTDGEAGSDRARHSAALQDRKTAHNPTVSSVKDSDAGTRSQGRSRDRRKTSAAIPCVKVPLPKSVVEAAAKHLSTLAPHELKRVKRRTHAPSESVSAEIVLPTPTYSARSEPMALKISSNKERPWMDIATCTPCVVQTCDTGLTEGQTRSIWDRRSDIYPDPHAPRIQRSCGRSICGVGNANSALELEAAPPDCNIPPHPENTLSNDMFGMMDPCWRLLEMTKAHMDKDQLEYMRGLILTHVKKPMSRDQLLERAESCLQKQGHILTAFVMRIRGLLSLHSCHRHQYQQQGVRRDQPTTFNAPVSGEEEASWSQYQLYSKPRKDVYLNVRPPAAVSEHRGAGPNVPAPSSFWGNFGEHKTGHPNHTSNSGADVSRSPPVHVLSHSHPVTIMPEGSSCLPCSEGGSGGFGRYPSSRGSPTTPITRCSRRDASYPVNAFNVGGRIWRQQPLHQPPQWQIDSRNAVVAAVAKEVEAARGGEGRQGST